MKTTKGRLALILAQADQATPAPWKLAKTGTTVYSGKAKEDTRGCLHLSKGAHVLEIQPDECGFITKQQERRNIRFLLAARADVPWLCDQLAKALDRLEFAEAALTEALPYLQGDYHTVPVDGHYGEFLDRVTDALERVKGGAA